MTSPTAVPSAAPQARPRGAGAGAPAQGSPGGASFADVLAAADHGTADAARRPGSGEVSDKAGAPAPGAGAGERVAGAGRGQPADRRAEQSAADGPRGAEEDAGERGADDADGRTEAGADPGSVPSPTARQRALALAHASARARAAAARGEHGAVPDGRTGPVGDRQVDATSSEAAAPIDPAATADPASPGARNDATTDAGKAVDARPGDLAAFLPRPQDAGVGPQAGADRGHATRAVPREVGQDASAKSATTLPSGAPDGTSAALAAGTGMAAAGSAAGRDAQAGGSGRAPGDDARPGGAGAGQDRLPGGSPPDGDPSTRATENSSPALPPGILPGPAAGQALPHAPGHRPDPRGGASTRGRDAVVDAAAPGVPGPRGADATGDTVRISADRATATAGAAERVGEAAPAATTLPMPGAAALGATAAPGLAMAPPPDAPLPSFPVTVPVPDPRFPDALGERVTWMVREGIQGAELTLHPQELGPIRIELSLDGAAASIGVIAANAETRSAIEQALPRLREMLAGQGLHLGGAAVDAGSARQGQPDARGRTGRSEARDTFTSAIGVGGGPEVAVQASRPRRAGGIDVFA